MLIQFNFKNFRSFKDRNTIDMRATKMTEYRNQIFEINDLKLLPIATFYGANASGKSNVYYALEFMRTMVLTSFSFGGTTKGEIIYGFNNNVQFAFDKKSNKTNTEFEIFFTTKYNENDYVFDYGFALNPDNIINKEWLRTKSPSSQRFKDIFSRDENGTDLGGLAKEYASMIDLTLEKEVLILSLGSKLKIDICKVVREWFEKIECLNFSGGLHELFAGERSPKQFENEETQKNILAFISSFDDSIKGFSKIDDDKKKFSNYPVNALHESIDNSGQKELSLDNESAGTRKMIGLYSPIKDVLQNGGVLLVDELNARLHPLLVRNIIREFANKETNPYGAQILFTTHDTFHLKDDLLRRDEIWFVEKNRGVSNLYSLADFEYNGAKIRKDADFEKNYLLGKYGAIPDLKPFNLK